MHTADFSRILARQRGLWLRFPKDTRRRRSPSVRSSKQLRMDSLLVPLPSDSCWADDRTGTTPIFTILCKWLVRPGRLGDGDTMRMMPRLGSWCTSSCFDGATADMAEYGYVVFWEIRVQPCVLLIRLQTPCWFEGSVDVVTLEQARVGGEQGGVDGGNMRFPPGLRQLVLE